ncbi:hypothetical protein H4219_000630 [Mycoemilia scoparia]|uniref:Uncharacterized protein n=1 Tax=Mycoemilia scoparia TaxID=417184 RepID=A0A9W8DX73_9FUNG|nr:hypothetical protein H4219_000630 [Mycoemilia scoparia]
MNDILHSMPNDMGTPIPTSRIPNVPLGQNSKGNYNEQDKMGKAATDSTSNGNTNGVQDIALNSTNQPGSEKSTETTEEQENETFRQNSIEKDTQEDRTSLKDVETQLLNENTEQVYNLNAAFI